MNHLDRIIHTNVTAFERARRAADEYMESPAPTIIMLQDVRFHHTGLLGSAALIRATNDLISAVRRGDTSDIYPESLVHEIRRFHS